MTSLRVTFWGVRGSIACPGAEYARYGGNTSCVVADYDNQVIIFDAGTGLKPFSQAGGHTGHTVIHLLLSHTHLDHIAGLPFFAAAYDPRYTIHLYAGHHGAQGDIASILQQIMAPPFFPIQPKAFKARLHYHNFQAGLPLTLAGTTITLQTLALPHPEGATGYRLGLGEQSLCYVTDIEHTPDRLNNELARFIAGTGLFLYDATFTDATFAAHKGWGHSTWQEGLRLAQAGEVQRYGIFHHNPLHTDADMDAIAEAAQKLDTRCFVAREGMTLTL